MAEKRKGIDLRGTFPEEKTRKIAEKEITKAIEGTLAEAIYAMGQKKMPFKVGQRYIIRTVTMVDVGIVTEINGDFITMSNASWIANTGRWQECCAAPDKFQDVENFKEEIYLNVNSIIDASPWNFKLPNEEN